MEGIAEEMILPVLGQIGKRMLVNRATRLETLTYITFLCYKGMQGGSIGIEPDTLFEDAMRTIDSLYRYAAKNEGDDEDDFAFLNEDIFSEDSYDRADFIEAFHLLLEDFDDMLDVPDDLDSNYFTQTGYAYDSSLAVLEALPSSKKKRVLDCAPAFLPHSFSFAPFDRYVMVENNRVRRAFFLFRQMLDEDSWKNVTIMADLPRSGSFDCIHFNSCGNCLPRDHVLNQSLSLLDGASLDEEAIMLCGVDFGDLRRSDSANVMSLGDFHLTSVFHLGCRSDLTHSPCLVYKRGKSDKAVTFASDGRYYQPVKESARYGLMSIVRSALRGEESCCTTTVPEEELRVGSMMPSFYLLRKNKMAEQGTVSLYDICNLHAIRRVDSFGNDGEYLSVPFFENDPRLVEIRPEYERDLPPVRREGYELTESAIVLHCPGVSFRLPHSLYVTRVKVEPGSRVFVPFRYIPIIVDTARFDPRFIVMTIQKVSSGKPIRGLFSTGSLAVLDLIRIPDIPIEKQKEAVEDYLRGISEGLPFSASQECKTVVYNLLVITRDKERFERLFGSQLKEAHFNTVEYASDSQSLKSILPVHFGRDVPVSKRVDAVLTDLTDAVNDTNFILLALHDLDVRKFYYSEGEYSADCIYDIFAEVVRSGLVHKDNLPTEMRRCLDTQMSPEAKLREEYSDFFSAAARLDGIHPDWRLSETVGQYLLEGMAQVDINKIRSFLSDTICRFFRDCHVVPYCMDDGAIPSFLADRQYYDRKRNLQFKFTGDIAEEEYKKEAWIRYSFVALFKLGNTESHSRWASAERINEAALIILMQVIIWLESAYDRFEGKEMKFTCLRNGRQCILRTVKEVAAGYFAIDNVHIGLQEGLRDGSEGVLDDELSYEANPRTIGGTYIDQYANRNKFVIIKR